MGGVRVKFTIGALTAGLAICRKASDCAAEYDSDLRVYFGLGLAIHDLPLRSFAVHQQAGAASALSSNFRLGEKQTPLLLISVDRFAMLKGVRFESGGRTRRLLRLQFGCLVPTAKNSCYRVRYMLKYPLNFLSKSI